jgi:DNA-binding protein H-NS
MDVPNEVLATSTHIRRVGSRVERLDEAAECSKGRHESGLDLRGLTNESTESDAMPKSLQDIEAQIEKLQEQARQIRAKEVGEVVARIKADIASYQLTPAQLFESLASGRRRKQGSRGIGTLGTASGGNGPERPAKARGQKVPIKYRDQHGNSWSGRGSQPRWLKAAIASGQKKEDFLVAGG